MSTVQDFTDLRVWQSAHELVLATYKATKQFPSDEQFALTSQMRRAAVSVTSNIAEGFGRHGAKEKEQFYVVASGSLIELKNQVIIARDLNYVDHKTAETLDDNIQRIKQLLNAMLRTHRTTFKK